MFVGKLIIHFSGLCFPDYDFLGRRLQDLMLSGLKRITYCSVPLDSGWGILFFWEKSSDDICAFFMQSLAQLLHDGKDLSTLLFNFVINTCENHAISLSWYRGLQEEEKMSLLHRLSDRVSVEVPPKSTDIVEDLPINVTWECTGVASNR